MEEQNKFYNYYGEDKDGDFDKEDFKHNKFVYLLAYFLFFVPLIVNKDSKLGRFYANQGLILLILSFVLGIFSQIVGNIPFIGLFIPLICITVIFIIFINAFSNIIKRKIWKIPLVGHIKIIKE